MEERERKRTGIASLKIRFNQVFGYYIEISNANRDLAPADYDRKQTLVGAERYTSSELKEYERKVLDADERILEIERRLYAALREQIAREASRLRRTAAAIAQLDVLVNFARLAAAGNYTRPIFTEEQPGERGELLIAGGRHPVIERLLSSRGERFVPNDLYLDDKTAVAASHHRTKHGRQIHLSPPNRANRNPRANGLIRPGHASQAAARRPHLHAHRRFR